MKVENKVIVVTGGGNGIGQQVVLELLRRGARVAAADIREDSLARTAELANVGDRLSTHVVDITDRDAVRALPEAVVARHGAVDGLINNAGIIQPFVRFHELDEAIIDRVLGVDLLGTVYMSRAFLPVLLRRPEAHLANVSSMGGFLPFPGQTAYGAAKAGVKLLTEGLYAELIDTPVGVSVVLPGAVDTAIAQNSGVDIPLLADGAEALKPLPAADAARIILDGIEAGRVRILVGKDARLLHGASRVAPLTATRLLAKRLQSLLRPPT